MRKSERMTWIFLTPTVVLFLLLTVYPLFYAAYTSFFRVDYILDQSTFVGIQNYQRIIRDMNFWNAVKNTLIFVVSAVLFELVLGTAFAIFFNKEMKYRKLFRTIVLIPMLLPPITVALTWKMMYAYDQGVLNYLLEVIGLGRIEWLSSTTWALTAIIITDIWQWTPFVFLMVLASLQAIPESLYQSARVSGATSWQCFRYITLPLLKPTLTLALLLRTIDTFRVFDKMYVLTGGGPGNATETITFYIYRYGFRYFHTGYAAAGSIIMVIMVCGVSFLYIRRAFRTANAK
ncbi:carbohydrate ABC transporter permease [Anoxynatronum buryatiense]|nr:sugar ABC transporter permease [Anoxynatronum buryatiense]